MKLNSFLPVRGSEKTQWLFEFDTIAMICAKGPVVLVTCVLASAQMSTQCERLSTVLILIRK